MWLALANAGVDRRAIARNQTHVSSCSFIELMELIMWAYVNLLCACGISLCELICERGELICACGELMWAYFNLRALRADLHMRWAYLRVRWAYVTLFACGELICACGELICACGELMWAYWRAMNLFERVRASAGCTRARACVAAGIARVPPARHLFCSRASLAHLARAPRFARAPRARTSFCSRTSRAHVFLLACSRARLLTCPKMLARSRCAPRSCRGPTYELICFEWSQYILKFKPITQHWNRI